MSTAAFRREALPYLEKAHALGEVDALYTLGLIWVERGETEKGIAALELYATYKPNSNARKMVQAIRDGSLGFRKK